MAATRQGSRTESATGYLQTVGLSEPSHPKAGKSFRWTIRRKRFCHNLVRNGGQIGKAATDAGYATTEEGSFLLTLPQIRKYIEWDLRNHLLAEAVTEESIISTWKNWADLDPLDYIEKDRRKGRKGQPRAKSPWNIEAEARRRIKEMTIRDLGDGMTEIQYKFHDPMKAVDRLAQVMGMMQVDRDQGSVNAEDTARDIFDAIQQMEALYGDAGDSAEAAAADGPVESAPEAPSSA